MGIVCTHRLLTSATAQPSAERSTLSLTTRMQSQMARPRGMLIGMVRYAHVAHHMMCVAPGILLSIYALCFLSLVP